MRDDHKVVLEENSSDSKNIRVVPGIQMNYNNPLHADIFFFFQEP